MHSHNLHPVLSFRAWLRRQHILPISATRQRDLLIQLISVVFICAVVGAIAFSFHQARPRQAPQVPQLIVPFP